MANDFDSFFPSQEEVAQFREGNYESAVVEYLLRKMKLGSLKRDIQDYHDSADGKRRLGLAGFNEFAEFPMTLGTKRPSWHGPEPLVELLTRPTRSPAVQSYTELVEEYPDSYAAGTLGLVFAWPKWTKFAVIHNNEALVQSCGRRIVWYHGVKRVPHIIETLDSLLEALDIIPADAED